MLITISFCSKFMFKCVCREICPSVLLLNPLYLLTGLTASLVHSKISYLKAMIWKYTIRYSTQHCVLVFLAWVVSSPFILNLETWKSIVVYIWLIVVRSILLLRVIALLSTFFVCVSFCLRNIMGYFFIYIWALLCISCSLLTVFDFFLV